MWISFNGWGQMIGGFVAYGISVSTRKHHSDIAPWKIVFLATGLVTVAFGLVFWYLVPDNQLNARWLSKQDRILAIERVRVNQQGIGNRNFKPYQAKEALRDPMTWALVFYAVAGDIPNGGISNFFSQLVSYIPCGRSNCFLSVLRIGWSFVANHFRLSASTTHLSRASSTAPPEAPTRASSCYYAPSWAAGTRTASSLASSA